MLLEISKLKDQLTERDAKIHNLQESSSRSNGCFLCFGPHKKRDCPLNDSRGNENRESSSSSLSASGGCWNCGGAHMARNCPAKGNARTEKCIILNLAKCYDILQIVLFQMV